MKKTQPWSRCGECGAPYGATSANQRCSARYDGKRCSGYIKSELRPHTWRECMSCQAEGSTQDRHCESCRGAGWVFDPYPERTRVVAHAYGAETEPIRRAFGHLLRLAEPDANVRDIVVVVPTKQQLRGTTIAGVVGPRVAAALLKGRRIPFTQHATLRLVTERTLRNGAGFDAALVIYASDKMLELVEAAHGLRILIAVPWHLDNMKRWYLERRPLELGIQP